MNIRFTCIETPSRVPQYTEPDKSEPDTKQPSNHTSDGLIEPFSKLIGKDPPIMCGLGEGVLTNAHLKPKLPELSVVKTPPPLPHSVEMGTLPTISIIISPDRRAYSSEICSNIDETLPMNLITYRYL